MTAHDVPDFRHPDAPDAVAEEMQALRDRLDQVVPVKRTVDRNILIATWNIRAFGGVSQTWVSGDSVSPKRNWRGMHAIAEIISRFDVIAIQEIKPDLTGMRALMQMLGPNWSFLVTDVSKGSKGNAERMGYVFDQTRVQLSGLAGELVAPHDHVVLAELSPEHPFRQFARTPYAVSFRAGHDTFTLVTMHVIFGEADERTPELAAIANWLADWANDARRMHHNLLLLGDFNIDREGDANFEAFTSTGLTVPDALTGLPRTVFDSGKPNPEKFYDQIAWFETGSRRMLTMDYRTAGNLDFTDLLFQAEPKLPKKSMSYRVSDHLPLWAEFRASVEG